MDNHKPHSANVLTDARDYWYSPDFIALMAKRWRLSDISTMLDVGCGIGHWGQLLAPFLSNGASIIGIDPEASWIEKAGARAKTKNINPATYQIATAETIPFPDNYFDMVTCQTVLVHVDSVEIALNEMLRVLKPDGLLAVAEPNNLVSRVIFNNLNFNDSLEDIIDPIRFEIICERGREHLGKGNAYRGDIIPFYFHQADLKNIEIYISDLADSFIPPYDTPRERLALAGLTDEDKNYWEEIKQELKEFYLAGGGTLKEFDGYWDKMIRNKNRVINGYKTKTLCAPGGTMMYLISGRKS